MRQKDYGIYIFTFIVVIGGMFLEAFVLQKVFNWFITVAFDVKKINYWVAFGLALIISFVSAIISFNNTKGEDLDSDNDIVDIFAKSISSSILLLVLLGLCGLASLGI